MRSGPPSTGSSAWRNLPDRFSGRWCRPAKQGPGDTAGPIAPVWGKSCRQLTMIPSRNWCRPCGCTPPGGTGYTVCAAKIFPLRRAVGAPAGGGGAGVGILTACNRCRGGRKVLPIRGYGDRFGWRNNLSPAFLHPKPSTLRVRSLSISVVGSDASYRAPGTCVLVHWCCGSCTGLA